MFTHQLQESNYVCSTKYNTHVFTPWVFTFRVCSPDTQAQVHIKYQVTCSLNMHLSSAVFLLLELTTNFNLPCWKLQTLNLVLWMARSQYVNPVSTQRSWFRTNWFTTVTWPSFFGNDFNTHICLLRNCVRFTCDRWHCSKIFVSLTEHPCEVWHFQLTVTISPPLILYKLNALPVYHLIQGSMSTGYAVFKRAIIRKFSNTAQTPELFMLCTQFINC